MIGFSAGFSRLTLPGAPAPLRGGVWYPTEAREVQVTESGWTFRVGRDAVPARGRFPLVLLSHGSGGWFGAHHDVAEHLARCGHVVAALTHPGDNQHDLAGTFGPAQLLDRPRQVVALLDDLLRVEKYARVTDADRIGVFGFCAGGYTALVLLGGAPDFGRFAPHYATNPDDPSFLPHWEMQIRGLGATTFELHDPRIRAGVLAAPALGFLFDAPGLARVDLPVLVYEAGRDATLRGDAVPAVLGRRLPRAGLRHVAGAGHHAFVAPCPAAVAAQAPDLCADPAGFDRASFHRRFVVEVQEFFERVL